MPSDPRLPYLSELERKVRWLSSWTIHHANHLRPSDDGLKVGGHQASSASLATIMTALYFAVLKPQDRVAVKPHASPIFHAIQYLLGHQTREKLENFRGFKGAQSYPSRTKDVDDVVPYAVRRADDIRRAPIGQRGLERGQQSIIGQGDLDTGWAALPDPHQPNCVETQLVDLVPVAGRDRTQVNGASLVGAD